jgi:plasmid stabilization system protein ParE
MSASLILTESADDDRRKIIDWLRSQTEDADAKFMLDLDYAFEKIKQVPESYGQIGKRARVATLRNFPYAVYFRQ